jgi:hypothetical protein
LRLIAAVRHTPISSRLLSYRRYLRFVTSRYRSTSVGHCEVHHSCLCFLSLTVNFSNPLKAVNNITSFFDKLSECFLRLRNSCPRYSEYQLLFGDSVRLQKALCAFYATVIKFCTRTIQIIETPGMYFVSGIGVTRLNNLRLCRTDSR